MPDRLGEKCDLAVCVCIPWPQSRIMAAARRSVVPVCTHHHRPNLLSPCPNDPKHWPTILVVLPAWLEWLGSCFVLLSWCSCWHDLPIAFWWYSVVLLILDGLQVMLLAIVAQWQTTSLFGVCWWDRSKSRMLGGHVEEGATTSGAGQQASMQLAFVGHLPWAEVQGKQHEACYAVAAQE